MFLGRVCDLMLLIGLAYLQNLACNVSVMMYFAEGKGWLFSSNYSIQHQVKCLLGRGKLLQ